MTNDQLIAAWKRKLPNVEPTAQELTAFALGVEVGQAQLETQTETTRTVDRSWAQFCAGIGDSKDAPYPGMIAAFESHYGQSFADKDWRNEASVWAQGWQAAMRVQPVQEPVAWMQYIDKYGDYEINKRREDCYPNREAIPLYIASGAAPKGERE